MRRAQLRILNFTLTGIGYFCAGALLGIGEKTGRDYRDGQAEQRNSDTKAEFVKDGKTEKPDYETLRSSLQDPDRP
jgi:hypothetical protein